MVKLNYDGPIPIVRMGTMYVTSFSSVPYCRISGLPFHSKTWQMLLPWRPSHRVIEAHWTSSWSLIQLKDHIHANPLFCVIFNLICIVNLQNITICAKDSSVQKRANKTMKKPTETTKTEINGKKTMFRPVNAMCNTHLLVKIYNTSVQGCPYTKYE